MTKVEALVSLFNFATACCNKRLWKFTSEFSAPLHRWNEDVAVLEGRHPKGSKAVTAIFLTPKP